MAKVSNVFVTGANRGIGLQLVKEILLKLKPTKLFAAYRNEKNSQELFTLAAQNETIKLIQMDLTDYSKFEEIVRLVDAEVGEDGLNLLINCAGIQGKSTNLQLRGGIIFSENPEDPIRMEKDELVGSFEINAVGPLLLTKAFYPLLAKSFKAKSSAPVGIERAAVVNISSALGSIGTCSTGGSYDYRMSKAALNAGSKCLSVDFKKAGVEILVVLIHPGWVKTDMGGEKATQTSKQSSEKIVDLLAKLDSSYNGKFLKYDGEEIPW